MRNVRGVFRIVMAATVVVAIGVAVSARLDYLGLYGGIPAAMTGIGLAALAILVIFAILLAKLSHSIRRARRPDQRVSLWHVSQPLWETFVARDKARADELPSDIHAYKPRKKVPASGVEVLAAKGGMIVDDVYLPMEPRGLGATYALQWLTGNPECIEVFNRVPRSTGRNSITTDPGRFRVPVTPAQREEAVRAFNYYRALLESGELSDPSGHRTMVRICWALAAILLPIGALGFWMNANDIMPNHIAVPLMAMIGTMGGGGAALVALIVWMVMLRR